MKWPGVLFLPPGYRSLVHRRLNLKKLIICPKIRRCPFVLLDRKKRGKHCLSGISVLKKRSDGDLWKVSFKQGDNLFLTKYCFLACFVDCHDKFRSCDTWKRSGFCGANSHAFYLRNGCAKTCGFCKSTSHFDTLENVLLLGSSHICMYLKIMRQKRRYSNMILQMSPDNSNPQ